LDFKFGSLMLYYVFTFGHSSHITINLTQITSLQKHIYVDSHTDIVNNMA